MPYVEQVILIYVPIKGGIVHPYKNGILYCSSKAMPLPAYNVAVVQYGGVVCSGMVAIYR